MNCTNLKYYLIDAAGKHICGSYQNLLKSINERMEKQLDILKTAKCPLYVKLRCVENKDENVLELYAFVFGAERGAI